MTEDRFKCVRSFYAIHDDETPNNVMDHGIFVRNEVKFIMHIP